VAAAGAHAAFITDKMAVGLYASAGDKEPVKVLTSGTPLEILNRAGPLCRVRTGVGDTGWLECRYVTDDTPARTMLVEAQARNGELSERLGDLQRQLDRERQRADSLQQRLRAAEALLPSPAAAGAVPAPRPVSKPSARKGELRRHPPGLAPLWTFTAGTLAGLAVGAVLLWHCRWRHRGLRI
jgi:hypothetical protein